MTTDAMAVPAEQLEARAPGGKWNFATRIGFRFAFCYWVLYCLPGPFTGAIPGGDYVGSPFYWFWQRLTPWVAQHLFHLSGTRIEYHYSGSGDTSLDFVQNFLCIAIAFFATVVWSLLDRKRREYGALYSWVRILVRFYLALFLLSYGISKIIPAQFPPLTVARLTETYGQSSPMGLLWNFMAASKVYIIFGGIAETLAAILLLFRRTTLLGALLAAGVLLNVVMLNFCYDVPVKLFSTNLLLMALFLVLPDASRFANVFLWNRATSPADLTRPHFSRKWMRIGSRCLMVALVAYFVATTTWLRWGQFESYGTSIEPPIAGVFDVESVNINGKPAVLVDPSNANWEQIIVGSFWTLKRTDGSRAYFGVRYDSEESSIHLTSQKTKLVFDFHYAWQDPEHLVLTGKLGDENIAARLHTMSKTELLLTHRGFHWINERPFYR